MMDIPLVVSYSCRERKFDSGSQNSRREASPILNTGCEDRTISLSEHRAVNYDRIRIGYAHVEVDRLRGP